MTPDPKPNTLLLSALAALVPTFLWLIAMLAPVAALNVLGLVVVMLPLWVLHDLGLPGLGKPENGFFIPSTGGQLLGAVILWLLWWAFFLLLMRGRRPKPGAR